MSDEQDPSVRDGAGRFRKGVSGNRGGLTRKRRQELKDIATGALKHAPRVLERLVELLESADGKVSLGAAAQLMDRAAGKPASASSADDHVARLAELKLRGEGALAAARARELDLSAEVETLRSQVRELLSGTGADLSHQ